MEKVKIESLKDKIEFLQNNLVKNEELYLKNNNEIKDIIINTTMTSDKHWYLWEEDCENLVATIVLDNDDMHDLVQFVFKINNKLYSFKVLFIMWEDEPIEPKYITWLGEVKPKEIVIKKTVYEEV